MKKEYTLALIGGLFLLSYVLEAVIDPLKINLASPYDYLNPQIFTRYPFTSAIIFIRSLAVFLTPLFLVSFFRQAYIPKGIVMIILAGLMQLYALQNVIMATSAVIPLEWALSLALSGLALLIPAIIFFLQGFFSAMHHSLVKTMAVIPKPGQPLDTPPKWLTEE
jgi:hypothetical protein